MADTTPENNPEQHSGSMFPNQKLILLGVIFLALVIFALLFGSLFAGNDSQKKEQGLRKQDLTSTAADSASKIIGNRTAGVTMPLPPAAPKDFGMTGEEPRKEEPAKPQQTAVAPQDPPRYQSIEPRPFRLEAPPKADDVDAQLERQETAQIRALKIESFKAGVNSRTRAEFRPGDLSRATTPSDARSSIAADRERLARMQAGGADELFNQRMAQLQMHSGGGDFANNVTLPGGSGSSGNGNRTMTSFESQTPDPSRWILKSQVLRPAKYSLLTGTVIPATLVTGINSDIPGQVTAQVSQNVYDTARGKHLLIPQGARLIGGYSANVIYGQERLLLGWQRIIFPDGRSLDIGSMPGTDQAGFSGVNDEVNNHYLRLFGSAMMLSVISAGAAWAADRTSDSDDSKSFSNEFASSAGSQMSQTSSELIRKNMNIAPTLTVRPGYRINIMVTKDITVQGEYQDYVY